MEVKEEHWTPSTTKCAEILRRRDNAVRSCLIPRGKIRWLTCLVDSQTTFFYLESFMIFYSRKYNNNVGKLSFFTLERIQGSRKLRFSHFSTVLRLSSFIFLHLSFYLFDFWSSISICKKKVFSYLPPVFFTQFCNCICSAVSFSVKPLQGCHFSLTRSGEQRPCSGLEGLCSPLCFRICSKYGLSQQAPAKFSFRAAVLTCFGCKWKV